MTQYKLSYNVFNDTVNVIVNSEIELAEAILDMERDCGMICHNVQITRGDFTDNLRSNYKKAIDNIIHFANLLKDAQHIKYNK